MPADSLAGANLWPLLFCRRPNARSLREICGGLAACEGKLQHLGIPKAPNRSTLAYANEHRRPGSCMKKPSAFCMRAASRRQACGTVSVFAIAC